MAARLKVTYNDGTVVDVSATPKAQVMAERFLRQQGGFVEATLVEAAMRLAFEASKPGIGNVGYEEWLENVADVAEIEDAPADPTPEVPSSTPSSD